MLTSSLCGYGDAYILVSGTKGITNTGTSAVPRNTKKKNNWKLHSIHWLNKWIKQYTNR